MGAWHGRFWHVWGKCVFMGKCILLRDETQKSAGGAGGGIPQHRARHDTARRDATQHDATRHGTARRDTTRRSRTLTIVMQSAPT